MMACLDVQYDEHTARTAALVFDDWTSDAPVARYAATVDVAGEYEPGRFYLRELPPLLAIIERIAEPTDVLIIDAYCYLSADQAPGLGAHLHKAIQARSAIVGVAKNRYRDTTHAEEVLRGGSSRPLFVTSIGIAQKLAASKVASMAGKFRIPTLLKAVDQLARGART